MATIADVNAIISGTNDRIFNLTNTAEFLAGEALNSSNASLAFTEFHTATPLLRDAPPAYQGNVDISFELKAAYAEALADFRPEFTAGLADYMATWFPQCIVDHTTSWICDTILNGGTGLPAGIETAIWERARSKEIVEAGRMEKEALIQLSSRNFIIPPGATAARMLAVQQEASNKSSTIARDVAIKHIEIIIENVRFAVSEGTKIRISVLAGVNDYIKAWMLPEQLAIDKARSIAEAKGRLVGAAAAYYNSMISEAELNIKAQSLNTSSWDATNRMRGDTTVALTSLRANVSEGLSKSYASAAAAAASGIISVGQSVLSASTTA